VAQNEPTRLAQNKPLWLSVLPKSGTIQTETPGTNRPKPLAQFEVLRQFW